MPQVFWTLEKNAQMILLLKIDYMVCEANLFFDQLTQKLSQLSHHHIPCHLE